MLYHYNENDNVLLLKTLTSSYYIVILMFYVTLFLLTKGLISCLPHTHIFFKLFMSRFSIYFYRTKMVLT